MDCLSLWMGSSSAAHALQRTVSFAENSSRGIGQNDTKRTSIFELEGKGYVDPVGGIPGRVEIDGAFNPKQPGYGHARTFHDALVTLDLITDLAQKNTVSHQCAET